MSEEDKQLEKDVTKDVVQESKDTKDENSEEIKADNSEDQLGFSPFIKESDRFDIEVNCYNDNDLGLLVEGVDTEFDTEKEEVQKIRFTFKHASQGDFNIISSQAGSFVNEDDSPDYVNLNKLEFARLLVLIRDWSLPEEISNANIIDLNPKITKSVIYKLREKISLDGIF